MFRSIRKSDHKRKALWGGIWGQKWAVEKHFQERVSRQRSSFRVCRVRQAMLWAAHDGTSSEALIFLSNDCVGKVGVPRPGSLEEPPLPPEITSCGSDRPRSQQKQSRRDGIVYSPARKPGRLRLMRRVPEGRHITLLVQQPPTRTRLIAAATRYWAPKLTTTASRLLAHYTTAPGRGLRPVARLPGSAAPRRGWCRS
jgi:hypothetical protein